MSSMDLCENAVRYPCFFNFLGHVMIDRSTSGHAKLDSSQLLLTVCQAVTVQVFCSLA